LAVVVLPHPDSPTRPKVSPRLMEKLIPSTALIQPVVFCLTSPLVMGKYFFKLVASRRMFDLEDMTQTVRQHETV